MPKREPQLRTVEFREPGAAQASGYIFAFASLLIVIGLVFAILSWGRGIGSASGLFFLEPLILAYIPAYILFGLYTLRIAIMAQRAVVASSASGASAAR